jgi:curved DNA-binding protein CbpA
MTTNNYYEVLGLAPFAEGAIVDQAYWHLAKTYQALAEADPRARQALDDLNEAYAVLGTPRLREEYDASMSGVAKSTKVAPGRAARRAGPRTSLKRIPVPPAFLAILEARGGTRRRRAPPRAQSVRSGPADCPGTAAGSRRTRSSRSGATGAQG